MPSQKEFNTIVITVLTEVKKDVSLILSPDKLKRYDLFLNALQEINKNL